MIPEPQTPNHPLATLTLRHVKRCIVGWEYQDGGPPGISKSVRPWGDIMDRIHCLNGVVSAYVEAGRPYIPPWGKAQTRMLEGVVGCQNRN